ncbi:MAG: glycosyltransferase family 4 protein [Bacteroidales bacterium]|nr:glycosyltransferase family 4 protein [Bacteroidales bacterium]MCM1146518.1 glycosyltransferase family 4 protein [Bacteroidales bacterium]MCM1205910.1 glycosyltransferase family 4 protein [Bacillota bacterium]MCM1510212.1 glycosyltransferase family 4 protein [Clostridium sp.]
MKIGFDAKRYYHNSTGLGNYSRTLVESLRRLYPRNDYLLYDEKSFQRTLRLGGKAAGDGCQIFHGLSNELPMDIRNAANRRAGGGRMRSVVTMHDIAWLTFPDMYHWADRHIYDFKYGRSCRKADLVVAISESTKRDIMRFYGVQEERIEVIYQPVQDYYYAPMAESEADTLIREHFGDILSSGTAGVCPYVLYVGSVNSRKNLLALVQAIGLIPAGNRPQLLVVGNGREYRRKVEEYIRSHRLEQWVTIATDIHNNRLLQALYRQAAVFAYPSFYEGFGLPVVEAALQRTPVITTTVSSLPEAAGADACLVNPHDRDCPEQMACHIDRLLSDTELQRSMGTKLEEYARKTFDPDTLTRQMMAAYERLIL